MRPAAAVLLACAALLGCGSDEERTAPGTIVHVGPASVRAEVADDEAARRRGLSGRDSLAPDAGMLFVLPNDSPSFWMKDMRFAIDVVWIRDGRVVDVLTDIQPPAGPGAPLPTFSPRRPANRALEVNAGWVKEHGIERGDPVRVRRTADSG